MNYMYKRYMVELRGERSNKTYLYVQEAANKEEAFIQARLRHAGKYEQGKVTEYVRKDFGSARINEV